MFFSGYHGVLNVHAGTSFVHIMVGGQQHKAWLIQLPSRDPRFWLFEEWPRPSSETRQRWAVEKWGSYFGNEHEIWYREIHLHADEDAFWNWHLIHCAQMTCMQPNGVPFLKELGGRPPAPHGYEGEPGSTNPTPSGDGSKDGFQPRPPEAPPAKGSAATGIERAPDALEDRTAAPMRK
jgi:hypothetical protein